MFKQQAQHLLFLLRVAFKLRAMHHVPVCQDICRGKSCSLTETHAVRSKPHSIIPCRGCMEGDGTWLQADPVML